MSKHDMIEAIRAHNPSASYKFLGDFDEPSLDSYLRRLMELKDRWDPTSGVGLGHVDNSVVTSRR